VFVNPAWESLTSVSAEAARGLVCTRRASGHALADLGRALVPPTEAMEGHAARARRPYPGTASGPPWWDIEFHPIVTDRGVLAIIGSIRRAEPPPMQVRATMPAAWAELRARSLRTFSFAAWESSNPEMRLAVTQAQLVARTGAHAIIVGPHGSGKESLARTIHASSLRRELNCIALDCARLPVSAIRGVLFGPIGVKNAKFLGTLYLNDPAMLPLDLQAEIAAALGDTPQVIAGCTTDPGKALDRGAIHPNLLAALGVIVIQVSALRQRRDDIPKLAEAIMNRAATALGRAPRELSAAAMAALQEYSWPGNLDELASVIFAAIRQPETTPIEATELPSTLRQGTATVAKRQPAPTLDHVLEQMERRLIARALSRAKGNKSKAADLLGVWRPRLLRRMEALGITDSDPNP